MQSWLDRRFKDTFDVEEPSTDGSEASDSSNSSDSKKVQPASKKRKQQLEPNLEELQDAGYRAGPSILTIKERPEPQSFEWFEFLYTFLSFDAPCEQNSLRWIQLHGCNRGRGKHGGSDSEEDFETREQTRAAATHGTDLAVQKALHSKQQV